MQSCMTPPLTGAAFVSSPLAWRCRFFPAYRGDHFEKMHILRVTPLPILVDLFLIGDRWWKPLPNTRDFYGTGEHGKTAAKATTTYRFEQLAENLTMINK